MKCSKGIPWCSCLEYKSNPMNHTPGEWTRKDGSSLIVSGPIEICSVFRNLELNNETQALPGFECNANLIASSPDLYNMCKYIYEMMSTTNVLRSPEYDLIYRDLKRAIDKAEGRYGSIK